MNYLVSATDTDAGKTFVTGTLLAMLTARGRRAVGFKPVASGAVKTGGGIIAEDASFLLQMASLDESYRPLINPYAFVPALAPDLAARLSGVTVDADTLVQAYRRLAATFDDVLVEGAGGITTALAPDLTVADLGRMLQLPVLIVCDNRLGAINRLLTTVYYCQGQQLAVKGIILNGCDDPDSVLERSNRATMEARSGVPVIGMLPTYAGAITPPALAAWAERTIDLPAIFSPTASHATETPT